VTDTGYAKMSANWIYKCPELREGKINLIAFDDDAGK
jgi:hypothetical protein